MLDKQPKHKPSEAEEGQIHAKLHQHNNITPSLPTLFDPTGKLKLLKVFICYLKGQIDLFNVAKNVWSEISCCTFSLGYLFKKKGDK